MLLLEKRITATIKIVRPCKVNNVKALDVIILRLNGVDVQPTRIKLTAKLRKRGNKLYGANGVYEIVT